MSIKVLRKVDKVEKAKEKLKFVEKENKWEVRKMINKVGLSQYLKVNEKGKDTKAASSKSSSDIQAKTVQDKAVISQEAKKAQEVVKYTKVAKAMPPVNAEKVKAFKVKTKSPNYLKNLAKNLSEKIADKMIEAIDARYEAEENFDDIV